MLSGSQAWLHLHFCLFPSHLECVFRASDGVSPEKTFSHTCSGVCVSPERVSHRSWRGDSHFLFCQLISQTGSQRCAPHLITGYRPHLCPPLQSSLLPQWGRPILHAPCPTPSPSCILLCAWRCEDRNQAAPLVKYVHSSLPSVALPDISSSMGQQQIPLWTGQGRTPSNQQFVGSCPAQPNSEQLGSWDPHSKLCHDKDEETPMGMAGTYPLMYPLGTQQTCTSAPNPQSSSTLADSTPKYLSSLQYPREP